MVVEWMDPIVDYQREKTKVGESKGWPYRGLVDGEVQ